MLVLYAIIGPFCVNGNYQNITATDQYQKYYYHLTPRLSVFDGSGFWDGTQKKEISSGLYGRYEAMAEETGYNPVTKYISSRTTTDLFGNTSTLYKVRINSYYSVLPIETQITYEEYVNIQKWQDEHGKQVILPYTKNKVSRTLTDVWYRTDAKGRTGANVKDPDGNDTLDAEGNRIPDYYTTGEDNYVSEMRLANDPYNNGDTEGRWRYADPGSVASGNYNVRLNAYTFFEYQYGFKPSFAFGTDSRGFDIFSRLAKGARFSFLLAICISLINLTIGAIYGAIEGYYGGAIDLVMERISDISRRGRVAYIRVYSYRLDRYGVKNENAVLQIQKSGIRSCRKDSRREGRQNNVQTHIPQLSRYAHNRFGTRNSGRYIQRDFAFVPRRRKPRQRNPFVDRFYVDGWAVGNDKRAARRIVPRDIHRSSDDLFQPVR